MPACRNVLTHREHQAPGQGALEVLGQEREVAILKSLIDALTVCFLEVMMTLLAAHD